MTPTLPELVEDRLLTVGDADDGEPAVSHGDAWSHEVADTVRPAMPESGRHTADQSPVGFTGTLEIENPRYAAHCSSMDRYPPYGNVTRTHQRAHRQILACDTQSLGFWF